MASSTALAVLVGASAASSDTVGIPTRPGGSAYDWMARARKLAICSLVTAESGQ